MRRKDIETAKSRMAPSIGYWRDIDDAGRLIPTDERVVRMVAGQWQDTGGVLVLTDRRVVLVARHAIRWESPLSALLRARSDCGAVFGTLALDAGGSRLELRKVNRRDGAAFAEAVGKFCRTARVTA